MFVEEWFAEDFPLKMDQSTNTTKFTRRVNPSSSSSLHKQKKSSTLPAAGLESGKQHDFCSWQFMTDQYDVDLYMHPTTSTT
jgi:hypothetical protein